MAGLVNLTPIEAMRQDRKKIMAKLETLSADNAMLRGTLETICNELQVWNSGGDHRSATWPESRIKRIRAALAKGGA